MIALLLAIATLTLAMPMAQAYDRGRYGGRGYHGRDYGFRDRGFGRRGGDFRSRGRDFGYRGGRYRRDRDSNGSFWTGAVVGGILGYYGARERYKDRRPRGYYCGHCDGYFSKRHVHVYRDEYCD